MTAARPTLPLLLCLGSALLPFAAVHAAFLLASAAGDVPHCNPYLDSCTSISATGRHGAAGYLCSRRHAAGERGDRRLLVAALALAARQRRRAVIAPAGCDAGPGLSACIGLVLYVSVLGEPGDVWRLQRRIGTCCSSPSPTSPSCCSPPGCCGPRCRCTRAPSAPAAGRLLRLCLLMLLIGICSVCSCSSSSAWHDAIEDAIEWQLALLLQLNFLLTPVSCGGKATGGWPFARAHVDSSGSCRKGVRAMFTLTATRSRRHPLLLAPLFARPAAGRLRPRRSAQGTAAA
jgi:hypothetical protein